MMIASYNSKQYREAKTKEEQCKVHLDDWKNRTEKMMKEYDEYCPKSKSNNIIFCPKKIIKTLDKGKEKKVQWINDYFKSLGGEIKIKIIKIKLRKRRKT